LEIAESCATPRRRRIRPALLQGAGNPESVSAGFETDNDPRDLKTRLSRFPLRLLKRPNDRLYVARLEASFRPTRQARRHRAQQPILAAQLENRNNRRIVIVGGRGRAGIEHLRHRSLLCGTSNTARNIRSAAAHPHAISAGGYLREIVLGSAGLTRAYLEMITAMRAMVDLSTIQVKKAAEVGMNRTGLQSTPRD
jgi:hypothetical protein